MFKHRGNHNQFSVAKISRVRQLVSGSIGTMMLYCDRHKHYIKELGLSEEKI